MNGTYIDALDNNFRDQVINTKIYVDKTALPSLTVN